MPKSVTTPPCPECGETSRVTMPYQAWLDWQAGMDLSEAWPDATAEQITLVETGLHPEHSGG
ncbi:hypothetical protein [Kribbella sp. NPDC050470]|uniref:hypothetical protein n=1 Tax=unclassified Kribbella TaxID=2644121 RepID=UPI003794F19C